MLTLYGIKNCSTVRKARFYLAEHQIKYRFHDYRTEGFSLELLEQLKYHFSEQELINTKSITWRNLPVTERSEAQNSSVAMQHLLIQHPTLLKRPILLSSTQHAIIGFNPEEYTLFIQKLT